MSTQLLPAHPGASPGAWQPRSYPQLLRGPRHRWWRGLLAIILAAALFFAVQVVSGIAIVAYYLWRGQPLDSLTDGAELTANLMRNPWLFLLNNLALAAMIPAAGVTVWACHGWRPRWVSSVRPGFRWRLLVIGSGITAIVYTLYLGVDVAVNGVPDLTGGDQVALLLVIILLTTPLQSAGEEYLFRGVLTQAIGSWFSRPMLAVLVSGASTALLFAAVHSVAGPQNFWIFFSRFAIGAVNSYLVWRTGGLEAAIGLHTVNNWFGMVPAVMSGELAEALSNPAQPALPSVLQIGSVVLVAVGVVLVARKFKVARTHDPALQPGGTLAPIVCWPPPDPSAKIGPSAPNLPSPPGRGDEGW